MQNDAMESLPENWKRCVNMKDLDLSENPLRCLPPSLAQLTKLRKVNLTFCCLTDFPTVLLQLDSLENLQMEKNLISSLPGDLCRTNLRTLKLRDNLVEELPSNFGLLSQLQELDLSRCMFQNFPQVVLSIESLKCLDLEDNNISVLPETWTNSPITTLRIGKNPLAHLNRGLLDLNLVSLSVCQCLLSEIPEYFLSFTKMTHLNLSDNHISSSTFAALPPHLCHLAAEKNPLNSYPELTSKQQYLHTLWLHQCDLCELSSSLCRLTKLQDLNTSRNCLEELPADLSHTMLLNLDSSANPLGSLQALRDVKTLRELAASACGLTAFPLVTQGLPKLQKLISRTNCITCIPSDFVHRNLMKLDFLFGSALQISESIQNISNLTDLALVSNIFPEVLTSKSNLLHLSIHPKEQIRTVPSFYLPDMKQLCCLRIECVMSLRFLEEKLTNFSAAACQLTEMPDLLFHVPVLGALHIENNSISHLSEEMYGRLQRIPDVRLDSNTLKEPPRETYEAGPECVEQYFRDMKTSRVCKVGFHSVVLLGATTAGKTSLIKTLQSGRPFLTDEKDRTIAVDEETWECAEDLSVHVIDFGGHDIYELVYPVFLKDRFASAVVAVDLSETSEQNLEDNLFKWLDTVLHISGKSSEVVVVGTKSNLCQDAPRKFNFLQKSVAKWVENSLDHTDEMIKSRQVKPEQKSHLEDFKMVATREISSPSQLQIYDRC